MVVFGQATGAIHVSIVDLILPETPCFPFEAFQVKRFLQTLRTNAFLDLSCDSERMLDLLSSVLKNSQSFGILEFAILAQAILAQEFAIVLGFERSFLKRI